MTRVPRTAPVPVEAIAKFILPAPSPKVKVLPLLSVKEPEIKTETVPEDKKEEVIKEAEKPFILKPVNNPNAPLNDDRKKSLFDALKGAYATPAINKAAMETAKEVIEKETVSARQLQPAAKKTGLDRIEEIIGNEKKDDDLNVNEDTLDSLVTTAYIYINQDLINTGRPYQIVNYANGYQFATLGHYGQYIYNFLKSKTKRRLSQAALETLSIIAYRQPITKAEVEQIRGVNSGEIINSLVEKNLVRIVGRKEVLGKPLLFGTTQDFLKIFGLRSLEDLPKLREIDEIAEELAQPSKDEQDTVTFSISKEEADKILRSSTKIELDNQDEL